MRKYRITLVQWLNLRTGGPAQIWKLQVKGRWFWRTMCTYTSFTESEQALKNLKEAEQL